MKPVIVKNDQKCWALQGDPIPLNDFKNGIKEAEKGPFYTIKESRKIIAQWREQRNSK